MPVYRIEQTHRTRVITDQYIVFPTSAASPRSPRRVLSRWSRRVLDWLLELVDRACRECGGTNCFNAGDGYFLTFPNASRAMAAVERLAEGWSAFERREGLHCPMKVVVHQGVLYAFRSYLYGDGLNVAMGVERAMSRLPPGNTSIFVTGQVRRDLMGTPWDERLQPVVVQPTARGSPRSRSTACARAVLGRRPHLTWNWRRPPAAHALWSCVAQPLGAAAERWALGVRYDHASTRKHMKNVLVIGSGGAGKSTLLQTCRSTPQHRRHPSGRALLASWMGTNATQPSGGRSSKRC